MRDTGIRLNPFCNKTDEKPLIMCTTDTYQITPDSHTRARMHSFNPFPHTTYLQQTTLYISMHKYGKFDKQKCNFTRELTTLW